jgi:hypothetical protein
MGWLSGRDAGLDRPVTARCESNGRLGPPRLISSISAGYAAGYTAADATDYEPAGDLGRADESGTEAQIELGDRDRLSADRDDHRDRAGIPDHP